MSMTLKKGQKAFAPKFKGGRRPPGSAQSSARPSVERQSQTPVPTTRPAEPIVIPDHYGDNDLPRESIDLSTPQSAALESPAPAVQTNQHLTPTASNNTGSVDNVLKRKAVDEDNLDPELTQKRPRVDDRHESAGDVEIENGDNTARERHALPAARPASQSQSSETIIEERPNPESFTTQDRPTEAGPVGDDSAPGTTKITHEDVPQTQEGKSTSRQSTPEVTQDDPSSVYPDPELSGIPLVRPVGGRSSNIISSGALNPDGSLALSGEIVPMATLNPDGTPAISVRNAPIPGNLVPAAALNPDGTPREVEQPHAAKSKKARTKRRRMVQAPQEGDDVRPTIEMQINRPRRPQGIGRRERAKKKERRRKRRGETPENAENEIIDRSAMTIGELCKDIKIGTKSKNHDMIQKQVRQAQEERRVRILREKMAATGLDIEEGATQPEAAPAQTTAEPGSPEPEGLAPRIRLVNGNQIVIDETSLQVNFNDRERRRKREMVVVVQENEFSKLVTSGSNMKHEQPKLWDVASTHLFYKGLSMFGTDFGMIAKMFPERNRRQIKLKFSTEERNNKWKLDKVLMGEKIPIDLDEFHEHSTEPLEDVGEIEKELREIEDDARREEEGLQREREEIDRQKRLAIQQGGAAARRALAAVDEDDNGQHHNRRPGSSAWEASAAPKRGKKGQKKKPKNIHGVATDPDNYTIVGHV